MNNEWLYQVRIKLPQDLADDLRSNRNLDISKGINKIARKHQTRPVCTLDGFLDYVKEAEKNDISSAENRIEIDSKMRFLVTRCLPADLDDCPANLLTWPEEALENLYCPQVIYQVEVEQMILQLI